MQLEETFTFWVVLYFVGGYLVGRYVPPIYRWIKERIDRRLRMF